MQWYGQLLGAAATNDPNAIANLAPPAGLFAIVGALFLWLFPIYILCAAFEAACLRWMIHGEVGGVMGLSLDAQTFRVWSCYWIWFLLNLAFSIVLQVVVMVTIGIVAASTGGDPSATMIVTGVVYALQYVPLAYVAIRLAPASATTIAKRKFSFFDAWTVTKGRFWALLGAFVLLYLIYAVASIAIAAVWFATVFAGSGVDLSGLADPARSSQVILQVIQAYLQSFANPQTWALIGALQLVGTIIAMMLYIGMYGINARAVIAAAEDGKIEGLTPDTLAKTFD